MSIKKGDKVKIMAGKDKGKTGKVLQVFPKEQRVSVEGINILVKNLRKRSEKEAGQKIEFPSPLAISCCQVICPKCEKPTRAAMKVLENQKKERSCKKCKESFS